MITMNQCVSYKRIPKENHSWAVGLRKCPQRRGYIRVIQVTTPRKPNSAVRHCCSVRLTTKRKVRAKMPGESMRPQKHNVVLIRGRGLRDTPGVGYCVIRGVYDCLALFNKTRRRSIYGVDNTNKIYVRRIFRTKKRKKVTSR